MDKLILLNKTLDLTFGPEQGMVSALAGDFEDGWKHIGLREGGFVNNKKDRGGATNWGITIGTYSRFLGRPASVAEVKAMPRETAKAIYLAYYWNPIALSRIDSNGVAIAFFDQAVNRGLGYAKVVQRLVKVNPDGHVGDKTIAAINANDPIKLIDRMADEAAAKYRSIVKKSPSQKIFLKGWLNRAEHLRGLKKLA